jgi:nucleotide-binding universal stress UspA family protein
VTVLDVLPEVGVLARAALPLSLQGLCVREREQELREQVRRCADVLADVHIRVAVGGAAPTIVRVVLEDRVDLLIKVSSRVGDDESLDALDMKLLRKCPSPVWVVPTGPARPIKRVLAAVDPFGVLDDQSTLNGSILTHAVAAAESHRATVTVVHAWHFAGENLLRRHVSKNEVDEYVRRTQEDAREALQRLLEPFHQVIADENVRLVRGEAPAAIARLAESLPADLIVIGTVARGGLPGLIMGNTAESVLQRVPCEVLAIKPDSFVSPLAVQVTEPVATAS